MRPIGDVLMRLVGETWNMEDPHTFLEHQGKLRELPRVFHMALTFYFDSDFFLYHEDVM